jgi:phosphate-selective porin OprO/OprP
VIPKRILTLIGLGLLISLAILVVCTHVLAEENKDEKKKEESSELGERRVWLPRVSFPPSDPTGEAGYLPLFDRDISLEFGRANFYLSTKRALELTIDESDFYLRVGGRIMVDLTKYYEDKNDLGSNGLGLRTVLVEADGRFTDKWLYRLSWGGLTSGGKFDTGGVFLNDAYLTYLGPRRAWIFGQHDEPFSLEESTSSLATTFMERALPSALVMGKNVGISYHAEKDWGGVSAGVFGEDLASSKDVANQGLGFTGRITVHPVRSEKLTYHLGGSFSWRGITGDDAVFFRTRPESGLTDVRYVNTGDLREADQVTRVGAEAALAAGPLSLQAEYIRASVSRESGYDDLTFDGWYAFVSWFPTGESRKYFHGEGIFGYPDITSKYGAVELAARYSTLDLNHGSVRGGKEQNVTLGLNWYISRRTRMMANYIFVFTDENATDNGRIEGDDEPQIFQIRLQLRI